jgi:hypothetical protein
MRPGQTPAVRPVDRLAPLQRGPPPRTGGSVALGRDRQRTEHPRRRRQRRAGHHVILRNLRTRDPGPSGNRDGMKLSGDRAKCRRTCHSKCLTGGACRSGVQSRGVIGGVYTSPVLGCKGMSRFYANQRFPVVRYRRDRHLAIRAQDAEGDKALVAEVDLDGGVGEHLPRHVRRQLPEAAHEGRVRVDPRSDRTRTW